MSEFLRRLRQIDFTGDPTTEQYLGRTERAIQRAFEHPRLGNVRLQAFNSRVDNWVKLKNNVTNGDTSNSSQSEADNEDTRVVDEGVPAQSYNRNYKSAERKIDRLLFDYRSAFYAHFIKGGEIYTPQTDSRQQFLRSLTDMRDKAQEKKSGKSVHRVNLLTQETRIVNS